jgi:hypothetical protein
MAELDFTSAPLEDILAAYFREGCVLLRHFASTEMLIELMEFVDNLYREVDLPHIQPAQLRERGLGAFHEHIFDDRHYALLAAVFGENEYTVSDATAARRVAPATSIGGQWTAPLLPHLDSFVHPTQFTVNFWVPFRNCGIDAPSLGVARATFGECLEYSGYGSVSVDDAGPALAKFPSWNYQLFDKRMYALGCNDADAIEHFQRKFNDRIWTPTYSLGDAMMLSNWTWHFSHALPTMTERRGNVELRFVSERTVEELTELHRRDRKNLRVGRMAPPLDSTGSDLSEPALQVEIARGDDPVADVK